MSQCLLRYLFVAVLFVFTATACQRSQTNSLILTGSSTVAPLAAELGHVYEQLHPNVHVDVQSGGSSRGISDVLDGVADIGMVSRALHPDEASKLASHTIAWDGITLITHSANPVTALTDAQVVDIYTGKIRNWKAVGGNDAPMVVVTKAQGRSTLELFLNYYRLTNEQLRADVVIGENQQGIKTVAGNPNAIGYVSIGSAGYEATHGAPIRLLPINGVDASTQAVAAGKFPLARPLNLVTRKPPSPAAQAFINFAQSAEAVEIVQSQFFVPVHER